MEFVQDTGVSDATADTVEEVVVDTTQEGTENVEVAEEQTTDTATEESEVEVAEWKMPEVNDESAEWQTEFNENFGKSMEAGDFDNATQEKLYNQYMSQEKAYVEEQKIKNNECREQLGKEWGEQTQAKLSVAQKVAEEFGIIDQLNASELGYNVGMAKMMEELGRLRGTVAQAGTEQTFTGGNRTFSAPSIQEQIDKIYANPDYLSGSAESASLHRQALKLFEQL